MNKWTSEWINEWMNEWMNKCISKWINKWIPTAGGVPDGGSVGATGRPCGRSDVLQLDDSIAWRHLPLQSDRLLPDAATHRSPGHRRATTCRQHTQPRRHLPHRRYETDMELGHWVTGSVCHLGHLSRLGHRVTGSSFWSGVRPEFFWFSKKCPKCKTYIWNAEMTKVIVSCLLLDWNHWMSVQAMNFYFYLWLLQILWPENTSSHISRHLEFIIKQGHRVNWVFGSLDCRVTGSLDHKMWPSSISGTRPHDAQ